MENSDKALIILLVSAVSFFSFYALVIILGLKSLFTALNIAFFVFIIIIVVFMYAKGSRAFKFIKLHPYITIFILIGLAITSVNTGLYSFIDNPAKWSAMSFLKVVFSLVGVSQSSQYSGYLGGFDIVGFFFGFLFMVFLILFFYDILDAVVHGAMQHSMFPVKADVNHFTIVLVLLAISVLVYAAMIWGSTALLGNFQLNPFYGTFHFIQGAVSGKINLSGIALFTP